MSPTLTTFLFEAINFLLLAALLGWLLFRPVRAMIEARQAADAKRGGELDRRAAEFDRRRDQLQEQQAAFETEMAGSRKTRLAAAEQEAAAIVERARGTAERERDRTARTLAHLEQAQLERLADAVAEAARQAVAHLLARLEGPEIDAALLRAACRELEALDGASLGAVLVESARPLGEAERAAVAASLGARAASSTFRAVPDLGAGVRITTGRGLIDASAAALAAEAGRLLQGALASQPAGTTP